MVAREIFGRRARLTTVTSQGRAMMKALIAGLAVLVLLAGVGEATAELISFSDDFEGGTLDPFWTVTVGGGPSATHSATLSPGTGVDGSQSLKLETTNTGTNKVVYISHTFATPIYGTVSVRMNDTGAGLSSSNYIALHLITLGSGVAGDFHTMDYDLGAGNGGEYAYIPPVESGVPGAYSSVERTPGWHQFTIEILPDSATFWIDDIEVYAGPNPTGQRFDYVRLNMNAPTWRPAFVSYFDDFTVNQVPEPSSVVSCITLSLCALAFAWRRRKRSA